MSVLSSTAPQVRLLGIRPRAYGGRRFRQRQPIAATLLLLLGRQTRPVDRIDQTAALGWPHDTLTADGQQQSGQQEAVHLLAPGRGDEVRARRLCYIVQHYTASTSAGRESLSILPPPRALHLDQPAL